MTEKAQHNEGIFDDELVVKLAKLAKVTKPDAISGFSSALRAFGAEARATLSSMPSEFSKHSPFDATHAERIKWFDDELLDPLGRLIEALGPHNRAWFSMWPHDVVDDLKPDFDQLREELEGLQLMAQNAVLNLVIHRRVKLQYNDALRYHIVARTAALLDDHAPDFKPSRGTYNREDKLSDGRYPFVIRTVFAEITGEWEQLDHLIQEMVDERRDK